MLYFFSLGYTGYFNAVTFCMRKKKNIYIYIYVLYASIYTFRSKSLQISLAPYEVTITCNVFKALQYLAHYSL